jgi:steroid delta-isomerase-like uncharacterized protein
METLEYNKSIVRRFMEQRRNPAALAGIVAPDYVSHTASAGRGPGLAGVTQIRHSMQAAFPDFTWTIEDMIAEGDTVVARARMRGTHLGEFMGVPATGKVVSMTGIHIYRIAGGKLVEGWLIRDNLGLLRQIGGLPDQAVS